jgi:Type II secretion system (T2SS), protein K
MKSKRHFAQSSGVALIVVLWAVGLISTALFGLVAILQRQIGQEVAALQNARAMLVADSGIQMALNSQLRPEDMGEACRQLSGKLQEGWYTGKTPVEVHFEIEAKDMSEDAAKININALLLGDKTLARSVLQNLFAGWEVNLTTSSSLIDALLDWVDTDSFSTGSNSGTEKSVPNEYFKKVEELEKVAGWAEMAKEAKEGSKSVDALSKFTVYGAGKLSLRSADQDLIEAWLGLGAGAATNFMRQRPGPDQIPGTADDIVTQGLPLLDANYDKWMDRVVVAEEDLWRVTSTGFVGKAKRKVVALISRKTNPPQVKARWSEEDTNP